MRIFAALIIALTLTAPTYANYQPGDKSVAVQSQLTGALLSNTSAQGNYAPLNGASLTGNVHITNNLCISSIVNCPSSGDYVNIGTDTASSSFRMGRSGTLYFGSTGALGTAKITMQPWSGAIFTSGTIFMANTAMVASGVKLTHNGNTTTAYTLYSGAMKSLTQNTITNGFIRQSINDVVKYELATDSTTLSTALFLPSLSAAGAGTALVISASNEVIPLTSSLRFKKDIKDTRLDSSFIYRISPKEYIRKASGTKEKGWIAEDIYKLCPDVVNLDSKGRPYSINYYQMMYYLVNEIQNLKKEIDELKKQ